MQNDILDFTNNDEHITNIDILITNIFQRLPENEKKEYLSELAIIEQLYTEEMLIIESKISSFDTVQ